MIIEYLTQIILRIKIIVHVLLNKSLYVEKVKLFGIPQMMCRNNIKLGKNVSINENVYLNGRGGITIKENSTLSYGTTILSTGLITDNWYDTIGHKDHYNEQVIIGSNVWLGANTTVLSGVEIVNNCIIGAGSLVNKPLLEEGYLYAGVPAKKIKKL